MSQLIIGGLLSTSAPKAPMVENVLIVLFAIVGIIVRPDYEGIHAPCIKPIKADKLRLIGYLINQKIPDITWPIDA